MALTNYVFQILFSLMMIGHILTSVSRASASGKRVVAILEQSPSRTTVSRCFPEFPSPPIPGRPWPSRAQQGQGNRHCFSSSCAFTTPLSGEILIDDIDIRTKDLKVLRSAISAVFQEPLLFSGTIEDNIRLGNEGASFEEVVEVAKIAQIHDFILSLPEGYDTVLSDGGENLSQGQRQLLAIARAFLKNPESSFLMKPRATSTPTPSASSRTQCSASCEGGRPSPSPTA